MLAQEVARLDRELRELRVGESRPSRRRGGRAPVAATPSGETVAAASEPSAERFDPDASASTCCTSCPARWAARRSYARNLLRAIARLRARSSSWSSTAAARRSTRCARSRGRRLRASW